MPDNMAVKSTARVSLRSFWPQSLAVACILIAAVFFVAIIGEICLLAFGAFAAVLCYALVIVLSFAALSPLFLGALRWFWRATKGTVDGVDSLFYYFLRDKYKKMLVFSLMFATKNALVGGVCFLPYFAVTIASKLPFVSISSYNANFYLGIVSALFGIIGTVAFILVSAKYYIAPMLFVCCPDKHWTEIFYMSKRISHYSSGAFLVLVAGMLGWIFLSLLGVTLLYTLPYMLAAYAVHCRYAFHHYNHNMTLLQKNGYTEYRSEF